MSRKLFLLFLFFSFSSIGQELPPVVNYGPNQYSGGNQNWMISQGEDKNFYFANGGGLLEYNGEKWKLYPVPNNSIVRAVKSVGKRIYTGAYMEAGYWVRNKFGILEYNSIIESFPNGVQDGELFWDVELMEDIIIFRSFSGIYFFDPVKGQVTEMEIPEGLPVADIFKVDKKLYFQLVGGGLYTISKGMPELVIPSATLKDYTIKHLYTRDGELRFVTGHSGFFIWDGKDLREFNKELSKQIKYTNIFAAKDLSNGDMVLGTVGKGIFKVDSEGTIVYEFNQENILLNNTVLSLYTDHAGNIWAGLDFGISMIVSDSPFRSFQDINGKIGSVYASVQKDDDLYLGTNQGLYIKKKNEKAFKLIPGTNGQVWNINEIDGQLFCCHDTGTFLIEGETATKICDRLGTWFIKKVRENTYVQGHYYGFSFLRKNGNNFIAEPLVRNFPHSSRYIEVESDSVLWVNNEHKAVFKVKYNDSLNKVEKLENFSFADSIWATSSMFEFEDTLYYSTKTSIYQYDRTTNKFISENRLNEIVADINRISGKMVNNKDGKLWGFAENYIFYLRPSAITGDYDTEVFYLDEAFRNIADGYENISVLGNNEYLLGIANGYLRFNETEEDKEPHKVRITEIEYSALDEPSEKAELNKNPGHFDFLHNNISFQYTSPVYNKYTEALYSYRLVGLSSK
ncbi:MAG: histidine kinase, partial [Flavobacteriaceae bacterium]|nr:histidine kinase [Flavobacteriaceae bacterium]